MGLQPTGSTRGGAGGDGRPASVCHRIFEAGGLFDGWVAGCPLQLTSPNAPRKRDILGTVLLSVLAGTSAMRTPWRSAPMCEAERGGRPYLFKLRLHAGPSGCWSGRCGTTTGRRPVPAGRASGVRFGSAGGVGSAGWCCCAAA